MAPPPTPEWVGDPSPQSKEFFFSVRKAGNSIGRIDLGEKAVTKFGRKSEFSDVVLDHSSISRLHARVMHQPSNSSVFVQDLGSTQGMFSFVFCGLHN